MRKSLWIVCLLVVMGIFSRSFATEWIQQIIYDDWSYQNGNQTSFSFATDLWYSLLNVHMMIGLGVDMTWDFSDVEYIQLIHELKNNASYNVIDLLEFEADRWKVMDAYLQLLDTSILKSDLALANLQEEMLIVKWDIDYCQTSKKLADRAYIDSVNAIYQSQSMNQSLQDSMKYGQCISDNTIQYSAKKLLSDKIAAYRSIVKIKYDYLSKNNDLIVDHYDLIRSNLLQTLLSIKNMLEKYDY